MEGYSQGEEQKNLIMHSNFYVDDVAQWCKQRISNSNSCITRKGKNWYIRVNDYIITVNAYSYTVITAHKAK